MSKYNYKIPEGYSIGVLPEPKIIETKFGMYKVVFQKLDDTTFTYAKTMLIKAGEYPKEEYKNYRRFRKSIAKYENIRILLNKKNLTMKKCIILFVLCFTINSFAQKL